MFGHLLKSQHKIIAVHDFGCEHTGRLGKSLSNLLASEFNRYILIQFWLKREFLALCDFVLVYRVSYQLRGGIEREREKHSF